MKRLVYKAMAAGLAVPLMLASARTEAAPFYSGSIQGQWTDAVLRGLVIDAATGALDDFDNTTTAACNLSSCPVAPATSPGGGGATVAWGDGSSAGRTSVVSFTGASFTNVAPDTLFQLGTLTYTNGTSALDSLIFGATLTLTAFLTNSSEVVDPYVVRLGLTTTSNTGTTAQNADFIDFGNNLGTTERVTFNVFEGATATAIVSGKIIGDPMLFATQITIAPGSEDAGFIGSGVPLAVAIPEPSTWWLCLAGLALLKPFRIRAGRAGGVPTPHA